MQHFAHGDLFARIVPVIGACDLDQQRRRGQVPAVRTVRGRLARRQRGGDEIPDS